MLCGAYDDESTNLAVGDGGGCAGDGVFPVFSAGGSRSCGKEDAGYGVLQLREVL